MGLVIESVINIARSEYEPNFLIDTFGCGVAIAVEVVDNLAVRCVERLKRTLSGTKLTKLKIPWENVLSGPFSELIIGLRSNGE